MASTHVGEAGQRTDTVNTLDISHWYLTLAHSDWNWPSDKIVAFFSRHVTSQMTRIRTMRQSRTTLSVHLSMHPSEWWSWNRLRHKRNTYDSKASVWSPRTRFCIERAEMSIDRMSRNFTGDWSSRRSSTDWAVSTSLYRRCVTLEYLVESRCALAEEEMCKWDTVFSFLVLLLFRFVRYLFSVPLLITLLLLSAIASRGMRERQCERETSENRKQSWRLRMTAFHCIAM